MNRKYVVITTVTLVMLVAAEQALAALIHHYDFSVDASDSIGSANGLLHGDTYVGGGVLNLDGFRDYVQFDTHLVPTTGSYTVAFFGKEYSRPESFGTMISQGWSTSVYGPPEGFYIGRMFNGNLRANEFNDTGTPFPTLPHPSGFHHFAIVVDSTESQSRLFVDGSVLDTLDFAIINQPLGSDTRFGRQFESSAYTEYFHGALDDIRIYDSALTDTQIVGLAGGSFIVPIPAAVWLYGFGLAGLIGVARSVKT